MQRVRSLNRSIRRFPSFPPLTFYTRSSIHCGAGVKKLTLLWCYTFRCQKYILCGVSHYRAKTETLHSYLSHILSSFPCISPPFAFNSPPDIKHSTTDWSPVHPNITVLRPGNPQQPSLGARFPVSLVILHIVLVPMSADFLVSRRRPDGRHHGLDVITIRWRRRESDASSLEPPGDWRAANDSVAGIPFHLFTGDARV